MDFEIPFRELGFSGVPHRSTAFIMPTVRASCAPRKHQASGVGASHQQPTVLHVVSPKGASLVVPIIGVRRPVPNSMHEVDA